MRTLPSKIELAARKQPAWTGSRPVRTRLHRVLQHEIQKRQQADQALRQVEHRYQSIFEHALEGIFQTSLEGEYIAANPALMKMYGYRSFDELAANINNIATQLYVDPHRRAEFIRIMEAHGQVLHFESEVRRHDGTTLWISENVRSIRDDAGNFLYYEGTVDDITELKLAREKLQRMFEALEQTQCRLESELGEAASYVRSLLPNPLVGAIETTWCYLPSSHLGGDGFGYHWLDPETLAVYLLDVSGHGVGSALLSISVLNVLRTQLLAGTDFHDPSAVLAGLNRAFPMTRNNEKYFTIWYGIYHQPSRTLTYASGGHHPAILVAGQGKALHLQTNGPVIGVVPDLDYPSARVQVPSPSEIYFFSDGVYEIARPDGSWQSWEEFSRFLRENQPPIETIVKQMREMRGVAEFEDDFSLLKMKLA
ncbi:MAG TPA: SpoIIE family protein phosphatase [Candidatus Methylacidiphilales bacterium]|jgi:sigma-B regulation protein RsbU (phosphoserine phosphatase)|nr:SpoIIE family protein phosphatase [Candidatus Methylacidiphilales bacterium]